MICFQLKFTCKEYKLPKHRACDFEDSEQRKPPCSLTFDTQPFLCTSHIFTLEAKYFYIEKKMTTCNVKGVTSSDPLRQNNR